MTVNEKFDPLLVHLWNEMKSTASLRLMYLWFNGVSFRICIRSMILLAEMGLND